MSKNISDEVISILTAVLQLNDGDLLLSEDTALFGSLPELDSMSVVAILTALEEYFDFHIEDDEIDESIFSTVGALINFVKNKLVV